MSDTATATDKRTGIALVFGLLAAASAAYLLVGGTQLGRAYGMGLALVFAALSVAAVHAYE
ncbi:DUF7525 family protein [Halocalculus aciditolerans]|uniref:Uncharacterized protein n=1 Tax=Halocalculus aciditolerans TaxID=1383812 RepID=A0A830FI52_9EURY|nr:hypothetical protein [Halocalculus aciditolerans]GGL58186.1 hypothetical protein GCM10009039_15470 [Halocalculus aciditolerans]